MSRIGKQPVKLLQGMTAKISKTEILVKGPKGQLTTPLREGIKAEMHEDAIVLTRANENRETRAFHGLCRSLLNNAVIGVSAGFKKELEILGIGYRAAVKGKDVELQLGYSHVILYRIPEEIQISVEKNTRVSIEGIDKQKVGQVAAEIRALRPPEPYKGKGVRYKGEIVRRKVGKAAVGAA